MLCFLTGCTFSSSQISANDNYPWNAAIGACLTVRKLLFVARINYDDEVDTNYLLQVDTIIIIIIYYIPHNTP